MKPFLKVMKALSDPTRVKMMKMLQRKNMCVCEIQEALKIAQSTASKHLRTLEDAGLVAYEKEGLWVNYKLADGSENLYAASLIDDLREWLEDDPEVVRLAVKLPEVKRELICRR